MSLDNSIYNNFLRPAKSVAEYDAEAAQGQTNQLALYMNQAKVADYQRERSDEQQLRGVVSQFGTDKTANRNALLGIGRLKDAQAYEKANADADETQGKVQKQNVDLVDAKLKQSRSFLDTVTTPDQYIAWHEGNHKDPVLGPELAARGVTADQARASIMEAIGRPGGFEELLNKSRLGIEKFTEMNKPTITTRNLGGISQITSVPGLGGKPTVLSSDAITQSADNKASVGATIRGQNLVNARAKEANNGADVGFTPDAITNAAARYNTDGTLPPMGMGKSGSAGRAAILNKAAELAAGVDPTQQRQDQILTKGELATRSAAVRSFATGKDGQAVQSANTALNHLETIRSLAEAQKSGDVVKFNQLARAIGKQFGQVAPTNLNAALIMVAPEVSKAVIGVGGTGHERDEAQKALTPNGSLEQIIGATETMQELFAGRLTEARRTYERTTKKTDFDAALLSPAARKVIGGQHGAAPKAAAVPSDIAALLKKHGGK